LRQSRVSVEGGGSLDGRSVGRWSWSACRDQGPSEGRSQRAAFFQPRGLPRNRPDSVGQQYVASKQKFWPPQRGLLRMTPVGGLCEVHRQVCEELRRGRGIPGPRGGPWLMTNGSATEVRQPVSKAGRSGLKKRKQKKSIARVSNGFLAKKMDAKNIGWLGSGN